MFKVPSFSILNATLHLMSLKVNLPVKKIRNSDIKVIVLFFYDRQVRQLYTYTEMTNYFSLKFWLKIFAFSSNFLFTVLHILLILSHFYTNIFLKRTHIHTFSSIFWPLFIFIMPFFLPVFHCFASSPTASHFFAFCPYFLRLLLEFLFYIFVTFCHKLIRFIKIMK